MIKQLSNTIARGKAWVSGRVWARIACYMLIAAALLAVYLLSDGGKIEFVYNEF